MFKKVFELNTTIIPCFYWKMWTSFNFLQLSGTFGYCRVLTPRGSDQPLLLNSSHLGLYFGDTPLFWYPSFCQHFYLVLPRKTDIFMEFLNGWSKEGVSPKHRPKPPLLLLTISISRNLEQYSDCWFFVSSVVDIDCLYTGQNRMKFRSLTNLEVDWLFSFQCFLNGFILEKNDRLIDWQIRQWQISLYSRRSIRQSLKFLSTSFGVKE